MIEEAFDSGRKTFFYEMEDCVFSTILCSVSAEVCN